MTDSKTHTITFKGAGNGEPWLVLGGATVDDLERELYRAFPELDPSGELPEAVWRANAIWTAVRNAAMGGLVGPSQAPAQGQAPQPTFSSAGAQPAAQDVSGPNGPAPACAHGPMQWVDPANKPWQGWFCPLPQGAAGKCKPRFV